jgi:type III restriction enzyme
MAKEPDRYRRAERPSDSVRWIFQRRPTTKLARGKTAKKTYFPHIVVDFDLKTAMKRGLVKSLVLDRRSEIGALSDEELEFKADRDENGNPQLSEGQRVMLRAGLTKAAQAGKRLCRHRSGAASEDACRVRRHDRYPTDCRLPEARRPGEDEVLRVDSNRKGELRPDEWKVLRERLFDVDRHANPRVIISVLMLREGFDVNNICVIVPLRASSAGILLEQTIGRGLRLMWRGAEYDDIKGDNRQFDPHRQDAGQHDRHSIDCGASGLPTSMKSLWPRGLVGEMDDEDDANTSFDRRPDCRAAESLALRNTTLRFPSSCARRKRKWKPARLTIEKLEPFKTFPSADSSKRWLARARNSIPLMCRSAPVSAITASTAA